MQIVQVSGCIHSSDDILLDGLVGDIIMKFKDEETNVLSDEVK